MVLLRHVVSITTIGSIAHLVSIYPKGSLYIKGSHLLIGSLHIVARTWYLGSLLWTLALSVQFGPLYLRGFAPYFWFSLTKAHSEATAHSSLCDSLSILGSLTAPLVRSFLLMHSLHWLVRFGWHSPAHLTNAISSWLSSSGQLAPS